MLVLFLFAFLVRTSGLLFENSTSFTDTMADVVGSRKWAEQKTCKCGESLVYRKKNGPVKLPYEEVDTMGRRGVGRPAVVS